VLEARLAVAGAAWSVDGGTVQVIIERGLISGQRTTRNSSRRPPRSGGGGGDEAPGATQAAVLVPLFGHPGQPARVPERAGPAAPPRRDLASRRSPGRSGRGPDDDSSSRGREIGLDQARSSWSALPPVGTFVTGYKVHRSSA
jgi:hypothetical protein